LYSIVTSEALGAGSVLVSRERRENLSVMFSMFSLRAAMHAAIVQSKTGWTAARSDA